MAEGIPALSRRARRNSAALKRFPVRWLHPSRRRFAPPHRILEPHGEAPQRYAPRTTRPRDARSRFDSSEIGSEPIAKSGCDNAGVQAAVFGSLPFAAAFAPPLETATSAGRNTRSPIV